MLDDLREKSSSIFAVAIEILTKLTIYARRYAHPAYVAAPIVLFGFALAVVSIFGPRNRSISVIYSRFIMPAFFLLFVLFCFCISLIGLGVVVFSGQ